MPTYKNQIIIYDLKSGKVATSIPLPVEYFFRGVTVSPHGKYYTSLEFGWPGITKVHVFDTHTQEKMNTLQLTMFDDLCFSNKGNYLVIRTDGGCCLWDFLKDNCQSVGGRHAFSQDDRYLLNSDFAKGTISTSLYDLENGEKFELKELKGISGLFSPSNKLCVAAYGCVVNVFDVVTKKVVHKFVYPQKSWIDKVISFSPDEKVLAVGVKLDENNYKIDFWDMQTDQKLGSFDFRPRHVRDACVWLNQSHIDWPNLQDTDWNKSIKFKGGKYCCTHLLDSLQINASELLLIYSILKQYQKNKDTVSLPADHEKMLPENIRNNLVKANIISTGL